MPIKTHTFTILDDEDHPHEYAITNFGAFEGIEIQKALAHILGPSIGHAAGSIRKLDISGSVRDIVHGLELQGDDLASAIQGIAVRMDEKGGAALIRRMVSEVRRKRPDGKWLALKGDDAAFDEIYAANYGELFRVLAKVIEVNFSRFFKQMWTQLKRLLDKKDEKIPSSNESLSEQN